MRAAIAVCFVVVAVTAAHAQFTLDRPTGVEVRYGLDSAARDNAIGQPATVFSELIGLEGADWLRVSFSIVDLAPGSTVRLTSLLDGEVQELDAAGLAMWSNTSAFFNGGELLLELIAAPGTTDNRIAIGSLLAGYPEGSVSNSDDLCGICGVDNRVRSTEEWTGRLLPGGCTASVWCDESCLVTAGHCVGSSAIGFRIPDSLSNCVVVNPPIAEQFPLTSVQWENAGPGRDWAVYTTGTNNLGQTPYQRYGVFRRIARTIPAANENIAVWGFGSEDPPDCIDNQTQQTHNGKISSVGPMSFQLNVDITFGNSGSSVIRNNEIVGIVTHCSQECPNTATRWDQPNFTAARDAMCPNFVYNLSISSPDVFVTIDVTPVDLDGGASQLTPFTRVYEGGTAVTLTAPPQAPMNRLFKQWKLNGVAQPAGQSSVVVALNEPTQAVAVYRKQRIHKLPFGSVPQGIPVNVSLP